jgi:hypothetical protein
MANGRFSSKALTGHLKRLASEAVTITDDGTPVTREEQLAKLIWDQALGYTEETRNEEGTLVKVYHKPTAWAQQYLYERIEGKAQVMQPDNEGGMKAADKVRDLAKQRVNALAVAKAGGPPRHKPKPKSA